MLSPALHDRTTKSGVVVLVHYYEYSILYDLQNSPPASLLHGVDDPDGQAVRISELSLFSQSVQLAEKMERRGPEYKSYAYEGLKHYFSTQADGATTQQMFQDALGCVHRFLSGE